MNLRAIVATWTRHLVETARAVTRPAPDVLPDVSTGFGRRRFLGLVLGGAAGAAIASTVDLDQLLWMPGAKTIVIPEIVEGYNALTLDWITREALRFLQRNLSVVSLFNRQYMDVFDRSARRGDSVRVPIRRPFTPDAAESPYARGEVDTVTLTDDWACDITPPTDADRRRPGRYLRREIAPQMRDLARALDRRRVNLIVDREIPPGMADVSIIRSPADGLSLRGLKAFDIQEQRYKMRLDILGGHSAHLARG